MVSGAAQTGAVRTYHLQMANFALWKSAKHYMMGELPPVLESRTVDELESHALERGWYAPAPALIARNHVGSWVPMTWVRRSGLVDLKPNQPIEYQEVREGKRPWPHHLGGRPTAGELA